MSKILYLPSEHEVDKCKELLGGYAHQFSYTVSNVGQTLIQCTWYGTEYHQRECLERASVIINEGFAVQEVNERKFVPFGIAKGGQLWVAHRKGHDSYLFDLKLNEDWSAPLTVRWNAPGTTTVRKLVVSKIVLVGEGNALRDTRRWIARQFSDGRDTFGTDDLNEIRRRANRYQFDVLFVVDKGYVIHVNGETPGLISRTLPVPLAKESLLRGHQVFYVAGCCLIGDNTPPIEVAFNSAFDKVS